MVLMVCVGGWKGQQIVDMNNRQTGSHRLGLMEQHFSTQRKLPLGGSMCPMGGRGDRDHFEQIFAEEIGDGLMVIAAWCQVRGGPGGFSV